MELLRLGLERGRTAAGAMDAMTALLERHGQWGAGLPGTSAAEGAYDNSYVIADPREAWVLETSGRRWVAARVRDPSWSVSNQATIRGEPDRASGDIADHARDNGWWHGEAGEPFDFAAAYTDPDVPLQVSHIRLQRSRQLLRDAVRGAGVDVAAAGSVLRDHLEGTFLEGPYFNAARPDFMTLCMHSHPSGFTWGNTASSGVFVLPSGDAPQQLWWAAATPCTSVYVPVFVAAGGLPEVLGRDGAASYWQTFQRLLHATKGDALGSAFADRQPQVRAASDPLEAAWRSELDGVLQGGPERLAAFTRRCVEQALATANDLLGSFARP